ncbi:hypothetical protein RND71_009604 [Anisodus tanguticus]|uniref:Uncharacterized protein n=1 Tax=Anisodus tanguticus TaxID=243964 RepID=A0AAE1SIC8_9SOLA|nr:hypothetical protein RND71_009604 [Anisodus tanguticus]
MRAEGRTKFAYVYLLQHLEYVARGVLETEFSFQIPRPLQENYVKKRATPSHDGNGCVLDMLKLQLLELLVRIFTYKRLKNCTSSTVVTPISWVAPVGNTGLLGGAVPSAPSDAASLDVPDGNSPQKSKLKGQSDAVIVED